MVRFAVYPLLALCAWGVLAIGAVYPWGYWPLAGGAVALCCVLLADGRVRSALRRQTLILPLACVFAAAALQLLPLSSRILQSMFPSTASLLSQYSVPYMAGQGSHPLSIDPEGTELAIVLGLTWAFVLVVV